MEELTAKELANKMHDAEDNEDDIMLLQILNIIEAKKKILPNYYEDLFMPEYRKLIPIRFMKPSNK